MTILSINCASGHHIAHSQYSEQLMKCTSNQVFLSSDGLWMIFRGNLLEDIKNIFSFSIFDIFSKFDGTLLQHLHEMLMGDMKCIAVVGILLRHHNWMHIAIGHIVLLH